MKKLLALAFASVAVLFFASCSSPRFAGLGLELTALDRAADGSVTATVRVVNSNVVAFNFSLSRHTLIVDGREIGELLISQPTGIPPQTAVEQTGTVTLKRGAELSAGPASYRLESRIVVRLWGDRTENADLKGSGNVVVK